MVNNPVTPEQAITAAEKLMKNEGYAHGPCLGAKQLVASPVSVWEVEFAYQGCTGPSSTTDPSTIELQISINGDDVCFLEPWWNRRGP